MGEPSKIIMLEAVVRVIQRDNLLANVKASGDILYNVSSKFLMFSSPTINTLILIRLKAKIQQYYYYSCFKISK